MCRRPWNLIAKGVILLGIAASSASAASPAPKESRFGPYRYMKPKKMRSYLCTEQRRDVHRRLGPDGRVLGAETFQNEVNNYTLFTEVPGDGKPDGDSRYLMKVYLKSQYIYYDQIPQLTPDGRRPSYGLEEGKRFTFPGKDGARFPVAMLTAPYGFPWLPLRPVEKGEKWKEVVKAGDFVGEGWGPIFDLTIQWEFLGIVKYRGRQCVHISYTAKGGLDIPNQFPEGKDKRRLIVRGSGEWYFAVKAGEDVYVKQRMTRVISTVIREENGGGTSERGKDYVTVRVLSDHAVVANDLLKRGIKHEDIKPDNRDLPAPESDPVKAE
jgi:hypothetical protein